jgi:predicted DNA-binding transcriptional regulator AlpA
VHSLPLLDTDEVAAFLHITPATIRYWRHMGKGPRSFSMGGRKVFYRLEDVEAWVEEQYEAPQPRRHPVA